MVMSEHERVRQYAHSRTRMYSHLLGNLVPLYADKVGSFSDTRAIEGHFEVPAQTRARQAEPLDGFQKHMLTCLWQKLVLANPT
jgi:hypothetical protein